MLQYINNFNKKNKINQMSRQETNMDFDELIYIHS